MNATTLPMNQFVERFRHYIAEERKLSVSTVSTYVRVAERFMDHLHALHGPLVALELTTPNEVGGFLRSRSPGQAESARVVWNQERTALRAFFANLEKEGVMQSNPTDDVRRVKVRQTPPDPPTLDEVLRLIDVVEAQSPAAYRRRNVLIVQLFFHCSLRVSELTSLDLDQVELRPDELDGYRLIGVRRKGDRKQHIAFNDVVAESIERYLAERKRFAPSAAEQALILSDRRRRMSASSVRAMIRHYAERAGIRNAERRVSPHSLRHASATEMERGGARPRVIQQHLGHASIQTTQRYLHTDETEQRRAVEGIGARFKARRDGDGRCA